MTFEEFINSCKEQELGLYNEMLQALKDLWERTDKEAVRENPRVFWEAADRICSDYGVHDVFRQEAFGYKTYTNIDKIINDHIDKLKKSITKVTGNVIEVKQIEDLVYSIKGEKADCKVAVTPAKLSSTKSILKARFKITDIEENLIEREPEVQYEESEFVKQWKQKELEGYLKAVENWKANLKELKELEDKFKSEYENVKEEYKNQYGKLPEMVNSRYTDSKVQEAYTNYKQAHDKYFDYYWNSNRFFYEHGFSKDFEEQCKKEIDRHFNQLQAKVENKIGRIIKIESLGGDDYAFQGEKGNCVVEVIWAGGYNIQRLHTRWIVKNI